MKKKTVKKTDQQNIEAAYRDFYETYNSLPTPPSSSAAAMENLTKDNAKKTKDMEFFKQFFESNEKLPEFIQPGHLRNLLGKRPGTFCWFLKYPTFLDMLLGVSPDCKEEEKARGESFIDGLKIKVEKELDRINKEIEERNKGLQKRNAELDKIKKEKSERIEEINKIKREIDKGSRDAAKGNAEIDKIKSEIAKIDEEIDKLKEPDKRNKEEKDIWLNLQKAINIYINAPKLYSELVTYVLENVTLDTAVLQDYSEKLIECLSEKDPLPPYIKQETLHDIILRAPVTLSEFFQYQNFFKRLIGFSLTDNTKDDANEKWKKFLKVLTLKLDAIMSHQHINPNATMPVTEELTQFRYKEIFGWINQGRELLDKQAAEKMYEKNCQDFAAAIDVNSVVTKNFIKTHSNPLGVSIEKEIPACLTASHLRKVVMVAPEYAIQYMDNYYFMARLLADEIKKGTTLLATKIFDSLDKVELAKFVDKDKIKLSFKHWEIRLRLNIGITFFIKELREFVSPTATDKSEETADTLNFSDKRVVNEVIEKLIKISADSIKLMEYQWIEQLSALMKKFPKSLANESFVKEINSYLTETSLLEEIKTKAQSLQQKNTPVVIAADTEEHTLASTSFRH